MPGEGAAGVVALYGRESVADVELDVAAGERGLDPSIEALGLGFQLATRVTSWVAVSQRQTVDPRDPTRSATQPHELAHGMSAEGLGLRPVLSAVPQQAMTRAGAFPATVAVLGGMAPRAFAAPSAPAPAAPPPAYSLADDEVLSLSEEAPMPREEARPRRAGAAAKPSAKTKKGAAKADQARPPAGEPTEPAPKVAEVPAKAPLFRRMADGLRRAFGGAPAARALAGRVVMRSEALLVCEIALAEALVWEPGRATVILADGTRVAVEIALDRSTRAGTLGRGLTLRICVERPAGEGASLADAAALELECAGQVLAVAL